MNFPFFQKKILLERVPIKKKKAIRRKKVACDIKKHKKALNIHNTNRVMKKSHQ